MRKEQIVRLDYRFNLDHVCSEYEEFAFFTDVKRVIIVVADEKTQTQKWCARICGTLICFISISAFFTAYSIMGSREGIKNFIGNSWETQNITENNQTDFSNYSDWNLQSNSTGKLQIPLLDSNLSQSVAETQPTAKKEIKLGIVQEGRSVAMDAANQGILKALKDNSVHCEDDQQNACGDAPPCQLFWSISKMRIMMVRF